MTEEPEAHWPTERMILEGHADYATKADLEELDDNSLLLDIAQICRIEELAPDECIPCLAFTIALDRQEAAKQDEAEADDDHGALEDEEGVPQPKLINLLHAVPPWTESDLAPVEDPPVADQFADKVAELSALVEELLNGPPIPPPGVQQYELALLVTAASRWVRITDAQGVELSSDQKQYLDATRELVARLQS